MSPPNHAIIDGRLLQTDKRFSDLKRSQQKKIAVWLYETYRAHRLTTGMEPDAKRDEPIVDSAYRQIEAAEIWIPRGEVERYYKGRKAAFRRRFAREQAPQTEE